ncbi:uncharacterized protein LOC113381896 [Ctenocephalides felis]|uniref:uncharacterized protein LOC113381896 n=1 Tax=Ctenocephalides felis TaxID=7515 RepID=UPI000E6E5888|nr:uncharacterized protein LOC113381896 [Ctenocephalides felis]
MVRIWAKKRPVRKVFEKIPNGVSTRSANAWNRAVLRHQCAAELYGTRGSAYKSTVQGQEFGKQNGPFVKCSRKFQMEFLQDRPTPGTGPYFDTSVPQNYTGLVGQPISLLCKVKNLGNRTVSWVRHRDIHLLTVGRYTYTSDQRFETKHSPHSEDWLLYIRYPQKHDTGVYECQISSTPPIGHKVYLGVVGESTT